MTLIFLKIDGQLIEAVPFDEDFCWFIKGTEVDRLSLMVETSDYESFEISGAPNEWGPEHKDVGEVREALDHFWPGWAERAS